NKTERILLLRPDSTAILCSARRGTKRSTSSYLAKTTTESTTIILSGPNAFFPRLFKHDEHAIGEI
ncbi:18294_t:CDS:1, partial [Gigaspora margarita]